MLKQEFLLKVLDQWDQGIHIVDGQGQTIFYNKAAQRIDGLAQEEVLGRPVQDLVEEGVFAQSLALRVLETRQAEERPQLVQDKLVLTTGLPIFDGEELEAVLVITKDMALLEDLNQQLRALALENQRMAEDLSKYQAQYLSDRSLVAHSKAMQRILKMVDRVASLSSPILIQGEVGVGKTLFARYLHEISPRKAAPFLTLDCSALPPALVQRELFGRLDQDHPSVLAEDSLFYRARGGTLFIDEIADMPLACQGQLAGALKVLEAQARSGQKPPVVRLISASNENLKERIREGAFREDLYYQLNIIPIKIPPLRERPEDIGPLVQLFLKKYQDFYQVDKQLSPKALRVLLNYPWPGNVSELKNVIERLVVGSESPVLTADDLTDLTSSLPLPLEESNNFKELVENYEKKLLLEYAKNSKSIKELATLARINESTLRKKISRYNLNITF